jgi:flagellar basal-body rod protein FlgF
MDALIYTVATGADRTLRAQQVHANNLANMGTSGFRANLDVTSAESLASSGYGYDSRHMAQMQASAISTKSGSVNDTGRDLDVALSNNGYLAVQTPDGGEAYTRNGSIDVDAAGNLTINGNPVLGEGGPIVLPENTSVTIGEDGTISILPPDSVLSAPIDKLKLVKADPAELTKNEAGLIVSRGGDPLPVDPTVTVTDRHLEGSNVSAVEEMVSTMSLNRSFEVQMKLLTAAETMDQSGATLINPG